MAEFAEVQRMYETVMKASAFVLGEGSMYERLRRSDAVNLDPEIAHAILVYVGAARSVLEGVHREYLDIGQRFGVPMIATSQTWRANAERISRSPVSGLPVNRDCVRFMLDLRDTYGPDAHPILIGGQSGPKGDGYLPHEAPSTEEAEAFHSSQIEDLAISGVDFLIAQTLPAFREALGIARVMARSDLPYVLSFVVRRDGTLLDGTPLDEAVKRIDDVISKPPANYNVNCVHASVFSAAMNAIQVRSPSVCARITGLNANTSAKSPEELDGLDELDTEAPNDFGANVWALHETLGTVYLGGCCGSSTEHIEALARRATSSGHRDEAIRY
jgi:homocysteine S-methyltransferase